MVWIWFGLSDPAPRRYDQRSDQSGGDTDSSESVAEPDTPTKGKGIYYYYYYSNLFLLFYRLFWVFFHSWMQRILDHEEKQTTPRRLCKPSEDAMRQHKRRVVFRDEVWTTRLRSFRFHTWFQAGFSPTWLLRRGKNWTFFLSPVFHAWSMSQQMPEHLASARDSRTFQRRLS